jgi:hypothetical protein
MDPENLIIQNNGNIRQRYETVVDGFFISDNLRGVSIEENFYSIIKLLLKFH